MGLYLGGGGLIFEMLVGLHIWGGIFGGWGWVGAYIRREGVHINRILQYDNIQKLATGQGDDYTTGCLLNYKLLLF